MDKFLIVGLGNPGLDYLNTKHNVGFKVIDSLIKELTIFLNNNKFSGSYTIYNHNENQFIIAKPLTFMNNSGEFVFDICQFYKIKYQNILVVYDDIDIPIGKIRLRNKGSSGGHNGVKNIINHLKTNEFKRIRIGIGKPNTNLTHHVLTKFNQEELTFVNNAIQTAKNVCIDFINLKSFEFLMNKYNSVI